MVEVKKRLGMDRMSRGEPERNMEEEDEIKALPMAAIMDVKKHLRRGRGRPKWFQKQGYSTALII